MDELKKYIENNKNLFDSEEPSGEHFNKFETLLELQQTKVVKWQWSRLLKVASVAILVVLSSLYVGEKLFYIGQSIPGYENPAYGEAKDFYNQQVNLKMNQIQEMDYLMTNDQKDMLDDELLEMDIVYENLKGDLKNMPDDQRIIDALIKHYKMKADVLNRIVTDLEKVKHKTDSHDESVQI